MVDTCKAQFVKSIFYSQSAGRSFRYTPLSLSKSKFVFVGDFTGTQKSGNVCFKWGFHNHLLITIIVRIYQNESLIWSKRFRIFGYRWNHPRRRISISIETMAYNGNFYPPIGCRKWIWRTELYTYQPCLWLPKQIFCTFKFYFSCSTPLQQLHAHGIEGGTWPPTVHTAYTDCVPSTTKQI
jgi:hypothetical protein